MTMNKLEQQLEEDRQLRNSARKLFRKELDYVRKETTPTALGERVGDTIGRKVDKASDSAIGFVSENGGKLSAAGALVAGVGLWLARKPIISEFAALFSTGEDSEANKVADDEPGALEAPDEESDDE